MAGVQKFHTEKLNLNDSKVDELLKGVSLASTAEESVPPELPRTNSRTSTSTENDLLDATLDNLSISEMKTCLTCNINFEDRPTQVSHYRSDWHRFNIKQKLRGQSSISETEFMDITDDISSISGSGSDSEDNASNDNQYQSMEKDEDELSFHIEGIGRRHPRVFLRNKEMELFSIYRCVIYGKKNEPESVPDLLSLVMGLSKQVKWFVIMLAGGHFAAAIFDGDKIVTHKTMHRYVVRAKRGTAQSTHDSQGGHAKSVGAFMRRHHEAALVDDIKKVVEEWGNEIKSCNRIFLRATGSNRNTLFNGKSPILDKKDTRIRLIPFPTRRPTFNEVKKVHCELSSIYCYGSETKLQDYIPSSSTTPKKVWEKKISNKCESEKDKIRQRSPERNENEGKDCDSSDEDYELTYTDHITNTIDELQPFESTRKPNKKRRKKKKVPTATLR